jgi:hypothetical protein
MQVDAYQYCPCGSGKKIKFCKCADNFQDLDKVERMISGGQLVAALDRINQLLKTNSSAGWLLAFKAQIQFQLREFDGLHETANRFWKLKPDNQLALWLMTISETIREENSLIPSKYFLDAVSEIRDTVHPFGQTAGLMLSERLLMEGKTLTALLVADLVAVLFKSEVSANFVHELINDHSLHIFARVPPIPFDNPGQVPWSERFNEVRSLFRSHRIPQAHAKLQSINKEFPDQPVLLSYLLMCELYRGDTTAAARVCERIAKNESVSWNHRTYYQTLGYTLDPLSTGAIINQSILQFNLSDEQNENFLQQVKGVHELFEIEDLDENIRNDFASLLDEEIGPKAVYYFFAASTNDINGEKVESNLLSGTVAFFGKQTDHPARLLVRTTDSYRGITDAVDKLLHKLHLKREDGKLIDQQRLSPLPLNFLLNTAKREDMGVSADTSSKDSYEKALQTVAIIRDRVGNAAMACLDGKTPYEVKGDPNYQTKLCGVLLLLQGTEDLRFSQQDFDLVREKWGLRKDDLVAINAESPRIDPAFLYRVDLSQLAGKSLLQLGSYLFQLRLNSQFKPLLRRVEEVEFPAEMQGDADLLRLSLKLHSSIDPDERVEIIEQLIGARAKLGLGVGQLVLMATEILNSHGRTEESQAFFSKYLNAYPEDPYLVSFIQQVTAAMQRQGPLAASLPARNPLEAPGADSGSGLWIPGQPSGPSAAPSSTPAAGGSSGKLWIPGME